MSIYSSPFYALLFRNHAKNCRGHSLSDPLLPFELGALAGVREEDEKTVQACSFSSCTRTEPGFTHRMHLGSRLATSRCAIPLASAACFKMGSTVMSLITDRCPEPRMGSAAYQCPSHRCDIPFLRASSKALTCDWARPCCFMLRVHHEAAAATSS